MFLMLTGPEHVEEVIQILDAYNLTRDDWTSFNELCQVSTNAARSACT